MADSIVDLNKTSSYSTLLRAMDDAATPLPLRILRMSHTGRVIEDGLADGTRGLISSIIGMPRDLWEFGRERIKGVKSATPEAERVMSSEWLEKKMDTGYTESLKLVGRERPQIREGTTDGLVHTGSKLMPLVGSLFIPGVGEARLVSMGSKLGKAGEIAGRVAGNAAFQLNAADMLTLGVKGVEYVAGVERPVEATPTMFANTGNGVYANMIKTNHVPKIDFGRAAETTTRAPAYNIKDSTIMAHVIGGQLTDKKNPTQFDATTLAALQETLKVKDDGVMGPKTAHAIDRSLKQAINPAAITGDVREQHLERMRELSQELKTNKPDQYNFDPRVMELQTHAYALGMYNKKIDGLNGSATETAMSLVEKQQLAKAPQIKEPEMAPKV